MAEQLPAVLVVGSGPEDYRRYLLEGMRPLCRMVLLNREPATWQLPLVVDSAAVDFSDPEQVLTVGRDLHRRHGLAAIVTWDESLVEPAAELREALGLPGLPLEAARVCRNKRLQRELFEAHGVPSPRSIPVNSADEAVEAAAVVGYPAIVKPSRYGASAGVQLVRDPLEARKATEFVLGMWFPAMGGPGDVLVEEYVTGPEFAIDSWVLDGEIEPMQFILHEIGFPPACEETGHIVQVEWPDSPGFRDVLEAANRAVGIDRAISHTEIMLTERGPVVIEINGRLGGDLAPYTSQLITGRPAGEVVAQIALGERPRTALPQRCLGGIRFAYPPYDMTLTEVRFDEELARQEWVDTLLQIAPAGTELRLPPRQYAPRAAIGIVTGPDRETLLERMDAVSAGVSVHGVPLDDADEA